MLVVILEPEVDKNNILHRQQGCIQHYNSKITATNTSQEQLTGEQRESCMTHSHHHLQMQMKQSAYGDDKAAETR